MRLGCMLYSLGRSLREGMTIPEALSLIAECGGEGVDLSAGLLGDHPLPEVRRMVADAGLVISSHIGGANLTMDDPVARTHGAEAIKRLIDDAHELGCDLVLVTTGGCQPDQDKAEARRNVASALGMVLPHARSAGLTLTIEDFGSPLAPYQNSDEVMETCELSGPDLMVTYDSGNMVMGDEDPVAFLHAVAPRLRHCHAKDWELLPDDAEGRLQSRSGKKYVGTVAGTGVLDYPAIISALNDLGYPGFVSFEYEGLDDPAASTRQGMAYLKGLIDELG